MQSTPLSTILFWNGEDTQYGFENPRIGYMNKYVYVTSNQSKFNQQLSQVNPWICIGVKGNFAAKDPNRKVPIRSINFGISSGPVDVPYHEQQMLSALSWLKPLNSKFRCKLIANQKDVYTKTPTRLKCGDKNLFSRLYLDRNMNIWYNDVKDLKKFQDEWSDFLFNLAVANVLI